MVLPTFAAAAVDVVVWLDDQAPNDADVKAGWTAFAIFLLLVGAVVVLGFSLTKQLRKAQAAQDAGVYGHDDEPGGPPDASGPAGSEPENHSTP
jgi:hypothetical protein